MTSRYKPKSKDIRPLEPEAYTVAIFVFFVMLLTSFLGSSYLTRYPETIHIQPVEKINNDY